VLNNVQRSYYDSFMVEDLQAALVAEPDNPEAMALLHQRSVAVAKVRKFLADREAFVLNPSHEASLATSSKEGTFFDRDLARNRLVSAPSGFESLAFCTTRCLKSCKSTLVPAN